jgi:small subunit ribosomal protein S8
MSDPIADMITSLKNAGEAGKRFVVVPFSKLKFAVAEVLKKEGFIKTISKKGKRVSKFIEIELSYEGDSPKIKGAERISKFSRRVYLKSSELRRVEGDAGRLILTTPKGVLTSLEAKKQKVGGEALLKIW